MEWKTASLDWGAILLIYFHCLKNLSTRTIQHSSMKLLLRQFGRCWKEFFSLRFTRARPTEPDALFSGALPKKHEQRVPKKENKGTTF
ncbi:hypothetical protein QA634_14840 [Methylobacterium sp. CB376]|uniref:hypothetical protein n=1 Tax=unclassified Methylobacterium TaxID=2615210 RepID=UPI001237230A|nr:MULTISPECIES: hypothetical protein [Methylobacterium]WFT83026.1 hypothetical protein QA634_14840 [Methylobacterium nodulans]